MVVCSPGVKDESLADLQLWVYFSDPPPSPSVCVMRSNASSTTRGEVIHFQLS